MRIGYTKIGRSWRTQLGKGTVTGGDNDVYNALMRLSGRHPTVEFILTGRNSGDPLTDFPDNVFNPWPDILPHYKGVSGEHDVMRVHEKHAIPMFMSMDQHLMWLGQHGTHNSSIPLLDGTGMSTTQANFFNYAGYAIHGVNAWRDVNPVRREEIWLCPDPRNVLKCRDLKWPLEHPVIAQYDDVRKTRHYRYDDPLVASHAHFPNAAPQRYGKCHDSVHVWEANIRYEYGALEFTAIPEPRSIDLDRGHEGREPFGIVLNENKPGEYKNSRLSQLKQWVLEHSPDAPVYGKWTDESQAKLGRTFTPLTIGYYPAVQRWLCTLTTPASGSGWATAKPWEMFAAGVVCFAHPRYDEQGHIFGERMNAELRQWLRVKTPSEMWKRIRHLEQNPVAWQWLVREQRQYFEESFADSHGGIKMIEERLGLI